MNNEVRLSLTWTPGRRSHFDSSGERVAHANLAIRFYSERARWRNCFVVTLCLITALCGPSAVQEGAGGGDEGEDGDRPEDEAVPALDEERRSGPADLQRRMRSSAPHADNAAGAAWRQSGRKSCYRNICCSCLYSERYFHSDSRINCERLRLHLLEHFSCFFYFTLIIFALIISYKKKKSNLIWNFVCFFTQFPSCLVCVPSCRQKETNVEFFGKRRRSRAHWLREGLLPPPTATSQSSSASCKANTHT